MSALEKVTRSNMLSQPRAADRSGQPLGNREKVRNKLRIPSWVMRKMVTSVLEKKLHNLPCEIISDIG